MKEMKEKGNSYKKTSDFYRFVWFFLQKININISDADGLCQVDHGLSKHPFS